MDGGRKAKYYRHLSDWQRASGGASAEIDGITGASVGSGKTLKISLDLADAMIDAGYQVHVDTAVEDGMSNPSEVVAPLATSSSGIAGAWKGLRQVLLGFVLSSSEFTPMLRRLHSLPGLAARDSAQRHGADRHRTFRQSGARPCGAARGQSAARASQRWPQAVAARHDSIDKITLRPTGAITVTYTDGDSSGVELVDPATGAGLGPYSGVGLQPLRDEPAPLVPGRRCRPRGRGSWCGRQCSF